MKPENILLDSAGHCKISDLGLAVQSVHKQKGYRSNQFVLFFSLSNANLFVSFECAEFDAASFIPRRVACFSITKDKTSLASRTLSFDPPPSVDFFLSSLDISPPLPPGHLFSLLTHIHSYAGTPGYTAPEVCAHKAYGPAVDFFSLGAMLYRLLLGKKPFQVCVCGYVCGSVVRVGELG